MRRVQETMRSRVVPTQPRVPSEPPARGTISPTGKDAEAPLGDVLEFMRLLWAVDHQLRSTSKRMESTLGLTGPQRLVLRLVGRFPGISAGRLAEILYVHPSTLTGVLKRLEKRNHIKRQADPRDGRKAVFCLTDASHVLNHPSAGTVEAAVQRVLSRLQKACLMDSQDVLGALAEELGVTQAPLDPST